MTSKKWPGALRAGAPGSIDDSNNIVIPAKAGTHVSTTLRAGQWIPAFAGMTTVALPTLRGNLPLGVPYLGHYCRIIESQLPVR
jgi:hypothetical protein